MDTHRTTIARVLDIPEILELIFGHLDEDSNRNNLTVCKKWSEIALNILWREVDTPVRLLALLSPLQRFAINYGTRHCWRFLKTPGVEDWHRFTRYARRVRDLHLDERGTDSVTIADEVFDEMSRSRTSLNILPNLRSLVWLTDSVMRMRYSRLFQHERIESFTVYLHKTEAYPLSAFFQEVLLRMPNLTNLDLRFTFSAREVENELIELFSGLTALKRVVLPVYTLTSRIISQLSKCEHLGTIQFEFMNYQGHGDIEDVIDFDPQLADGAFPALWDLSLSVRLPCMTKFIANGFAPPLLTSLYIHILSAQTAETLSHFLDVLSDKCPQLNHLYLDFFTSANIPPTPLEWVRPDWPSLRPLLKFPKLISLELRWDRPLDFSLADIEEMASKWPYLETLLLNCEPMDMTIPPVLDLRALLPFARHCPKLVELGLYMNASDDVPIPQLDSHTKPFKSLKEIVVGGSKITNVGYVAMFLSQVCPPGCEIVFGVAWPDGVGVVETAENGAELRRMQEEASANFSRWEEVDKVLPLLVQLRMDERAAREALEKEAEDLRIRCRLLAERAEVKVQPDGSCVPF